MPDNLYSMSVGKDQKLRQLLHNAGLDGDMIQALLDSPAGFNLLDDTVMASNELAVWWVAQLRQKLTADPLDRLAAKIIPVHDWLEVLRRYNRQYWDNRLTDEQFVEAAAQREDAQLGNHIQSVSNLYGFHVEFGSPAETVAMWLRVFREELPNAELWGPLRFDEAHFRLNDLAETYDPGIHLVWVDLTAHWEPKDARTIDEVRSQARDAGEKLAQLEMFSIWGVLTDLFQCQNGTDLPFTYMAGTELTVLRLGDSLAWCRVLCMCWNHGDRAWVGPTGTTEYSRQWSTPAVRKVW